MVLRPVRKSVFWSQSVRETLMFNSMWVRENFVSTYLVIDRPFLIIP